MEVIFNEYIAAYRSNRSNFETIKWLKAHESPYRKAIEILNGKDLCQASIAFGLFREAGFIIEPVHRNETKRLNEFGLGNK